MTHLTKLLCGGTSKAADAARAARADGLLTESLARHLVDLACGCGDSPCGESVLALTYLVLVGAPVATTSTTESA